MDCAYCGQAATVRIPSIPDFVCHEHAVEFWTGLVAYAKECLVDAEQQEHPPSLCWTCNQLSAERALSKAATAAGPPPREEAPVAARADYQPGELASAQSTQ
jgi:hypothetical protein